MLFYDVYINKYTELKLGEDHLYNVTTRPNNECSLREQYPTLFNSQN